jgi:tRNA threonylcarbamoyladenosine biosynthesis protein TsaB
VTMLILAADTSGKYGGIALVRFEVKAKNFNRKQREELPHSSQGVTADPIEAVSLQGGTFSAQLVPQIAGLLSKHKLSKREIDAFAVVSGPGSFTGLRVGLAAIKALAEILQKPIAAVSLLEVMAFHLASRNLPKAAGAGETAGAILTALDAGRNEAYVGEYRASENLPVCVSERLLTIDELASRAEQLRQPIHTPDENLSRSLSSRGDRSRFNIVLSDRPNSVAVAALGYRKILAGQSFSPLELDANYIRRADAEIKNPIRPST